MHFTNKKPSEKRSELKNNLKKQKILRFPGAYNPLTSKLISQIGFDGVYISGAVMANCSSSSHDAKINVKTRNR